jgi:hypothetical protein
VEAQELYLACKRFHWLWAVEARITTVKQTRFGKLSNAFIVVVPYGQNTQLVAKFVENLTFQLGEVPNVGGAV